MKSKDAGEQQPDSPEIKQSARNTARDGHHTDAEDAKSRAAAQNRRLAPKGKLLPPTNEELIAAVREAADCCAAEADSTAHLPVSRRTLAILATLAAAQLNMRVDITA